MNEPEKLMRDFNNLLYVSERIRGNVPDVAEIRPSVQCAMDCGLHDLRFTAKYYAWNNRHREGQRVFSKIDKVLTNQEWVSLFLESETHFLPENVSYHSLVVEKFFNMNLSPRPFKYFNKWSSANNFTEIVQKQWDDRVDGTRMF